MILDELAHAALYAPVGKGIAGALEFLANADLAGMDEGMHHIEGDQIYAMVLDYNTKPRNQCVWEAHRRYLDVQYIVSGVERMGCADLDRMTPVGDYDEAKDVLFLEGEGSFFILRAGAFAIFAPHDVHMPGIAVAEPEPVRKVVVKVLV